MLTIGSVCAGAGGLDLAAEALFGPLEHLWFAEIDPHAAAVYSAHWPVPNLGDMTAADWSAVECPAVLAAGVPCQGWSTAGKWLGSADERDLWPVGKFAPDGTPRRGLVDVLTELRPGLLLFENVASLVRAEDGSAWSVILADLHQLGYAVSWTTVGACKVGACHHRHRVYLAATLVDVEVPESAPLAWLDGDRWYGTAGDLFGGFTSFADWPRAGLSVGGQVWPLPEDVCGADGIVLPTPRATDTGSAGRRASEGWRPPLSEAVLNLLPTATAADGQRSSTTMVRGNPTLVGALLPTPTRADGSSGPGHAGSAQGTPDLRTTVSRMLPTPVAAGGGLNRGSSAGNGLRNTVREMSALLPTPTVTNWHGNETNDRGDLLLPGAVQPGRFGDYEPAVRRHEALLGGPAPEPTEPGRLGRPRLTAAFPEWMCCFPAGWITDHATRAAAIRIAGNSVVWPAAAYAYSILPTLVVPVPAAGAGRAA